MPGGRDIAYAGTYFQTLHLVRADGGEAPREILKGQLANGVWSSFSVHPDGRIGLFGINAAGQIGFFLVRPRPRPVALVVQREGAPGRLAELLCPRALERER